MLQSSPSDVRRKISEMLQARMSGQISRLLGYFAQDIVLHCACSREGVLSPGIWRGRDALRSVSRLTDENYQPVDHEILEIVIDGSASAVRWRGEWRQLATNKICFIDAAHFLHWRDGVVVEMHEYFQHTSETTPHCAAALISGNLLAETLPGASREEIGYRARQLVAFPSNGPEIGAIQKLCAPDIVCDFVGDRARIPYAGKHVGIDALINVVRAVAIDFEQSRCDINAILIENGHVAGRRQVEWRHRGTGRRGVVDLANFLRFENGMIVELIEFRDSITLLEMQGKIKNQ